MKGSFLAVILFTCCVAGAQPGRYIIQFKNKGQNPFSLSSPEQFLSARAIERRTRYHISYDSTDLPLTPAYIDSLRSITSITVLNSSKWLNQVSVQVSITEALDSISRFSFVQSVNYTASALPRTVRTPDSVYPTPNIQGTVGEAAFQYGASKAQVTIHHGNFLHNLGLQGQGMIISLLDAGFYHYKTLSAFDSVNQNGQVLGTWDFVAREASVDEDHPHGMYCFSTIAANRPDTFVGTAPKASFYLFRSEDAASEYPIEEHNWVCAAERVDSAGGDVISSSLGYGQFNDPALNHVYADMNGNTTVIANGADLAAKKGILVVNAAGNEGNKAWKYIMTPADGDSVLAVGAVDTSGAPGVFSSYGPSADGRVKPDVASVGVGTIVQGTNNALLAGNGTSFACPNLAGLVACLWQGFPEMNNMQIIDALRRSSSRTANPDDRVGYGIPDMKKAVQILLQETATVTAGTCANLSWTSKDVSGMRYEIERRKTGEQNFTVIGSQDGTGTVFTTHTYQFSDAQLSSSDGAVQYRVRQVIDTSATGFMDLVLDTVTLAAGLACGPMPATEKGFQIIPNPVRSTFQLKIDRSAASSLRLQIINALGQLLYEKQVAAPAGMSLVSVSPAPLAAGVYFMVIYENNKRIDSKPFLKF